VLEAKRLKMNTGKMKVLFAYSMKDRVVEKGPAMNLIISIKN